MAVLLKNLLARAPKTEDLEAIRELVLACDTAEFGAADNTMEDLLSNWQQCGFNLATDAWVIVTTKGQLVGFACVWHRDHEQISMFLCVHPEYRNRGIGTLLLRLVEERARLHVLYARRGTRVTLRGTVASNNQQARRLFEREGYTSVRQFWRIALEVEEALSASKPQGKLQIELDVDSLRLYGASQCYERDAIFVVHQYNTYEKELRVGEDSMLLDGEWDTISCAS
ncbi:MAG TPA: GNAT family N-acetyltransferase [Ktedonobacteraceae bacterium]|nr:GNAT family N-acetyltransferase [Ktedonobacteraceae bacterium]